jgi:hypothetical protein
MKLTVDDFIMKKQKRVVRFGSVVFGKVEYHGVFETGYIGNGGSTYDVFIRRWAVFQTETLVTVTFGSPVSIYLLKKFLKPQYFGVEYIIHCGGESMRMDADSMPWERRKDYYV